MRIPKSLKKLSHGEKYAKNVNNIMHLYASLTTVLRQIDVRSIARLAYQTHSPWRANTGFR